MMPSPPTALRPERPCGRRLRPGLILAAVLASQGIGGRAYAAAPADAADIQARAEVVTAMAINDLYLIGAAQLAFAKADTPSKKAVADRLMREARARYEALENPALAAGVPFPTSVDLRRRQWMRDLGALRGDAFDRLFAKQRLAGAVETLAKVEAYAHGGDGFYVKEYTGAEIPRLNAMISTLKSGAVRSD